MRIATRCTVVVAGVLAAGCAAPIKYYSLSPVPSKPSMVQFISPWTASSTFALYEDPGTCKGIQRVAFFQAGVNKKVYVPQSKYVTFSAYAQSAGTSFVYATSMYTVPLESGDLRIRISYPPGGMVTHIQRRKDGGQWMPVKNAIERQFTRPFLESGDWCKPIPGIS